tara:strand:+ start:13020 stop:13259 length:240 start_codon:yes stop_codon:yes gene_type:complete
MNTELTNNQVFGGQRDLGFRFESNGGTATLQFQKSDGSWVNESGTDQSTADMLFRLDLFTDQKYRWVITGSAKMYREPK